MSLDFILLGMLRKPASGYDIKLGFEQGGKYIWSAELSQIYPALQQMRKRGLLKSSMVPSEKGPPRKVYERTAKGTKAFHAWLRGEPIMGTERFAYIAQLIYLGELNDLQHTISFLQQLRARLACFHKLLEGASADVLGTQSIDQLSHVTFHEWISLELGVRSLAAKVNWCDQAMVMAKQRLDREKSHVRSA